MSKQRYSSKTLASKMFDNICNEINGEITVLQKCCGFHEFGSFPETSSLEAIISCYDDIFDDCHLNGYDQFLKEYSLEKISNEFLNIYSKHISDLIKEEGYPCIVTLLIEEQKYICDVFKKVSETLPMTILENVRSGSTGNTLTTFIYAPTQ